MTKYIALLGLASAFVLTACGNNERVPGPPQFEWIDGPIFLDIGLACDPEDAEQLQTDFNNCGSCGVKCDSEDADSCWNGFCRCGNGPSCTVGSDCIAGRCLEADRFTECDTAMDCSHDSGQQQCIKDEIDSSGFCIDVCEFHTDCPSGFACVESACTRRACETEACDGIDNDCDGLIDENSDGTGPLSQWCLTGGDPSTVPMPPCQRGTQVCSAGVWSECLNEVAPADEVGLLACNSRDDDCDGCVDGHFNESGVCVATDPVGFDVLYLIDLSGSMGAEIEAVKMATETFSAIYAGSPDFRFGLVAISGGNDLNGRAYVLHDFSDFVSFNAALSTIGKEQGAGLEPTWDAIYESVTGEISYALDLDRDGALDTPDESRRGLSWRPGSIRIMIMFGDEEAQSARDARGLDRVSETAMCDSLLNGETLVVFTQTVHFEDYDDCAQVYPLTIEPEVMVDNLESVIVDPCL